MNKLLAEARRKMKGQKAKVAAGFDNSPIPEGKYTGEIKQCEVMNREVKGVMQPCLVTRIAITMGEKSGRNVWPFAPSLITPEGCTAAARNIGAVLGAEAITSGKQVGGEMVLDIDRFMGEVESLAAVCVGEAVEINIKNSKKQRQDGTPYQGIYINRGLGEDAASLGAQDEDDNLDMTPPPARTARRTIVKRR